MLLRLTLPGQFDVNGDLEKKGDQQEAGCPDAEGDHDFTEGRGVLGNRFEHGRHETADDQADALVGPQGTERG